MKFSVVLLPTGPLAICLAQQTTSVVVFAHDIERECMTGSPIDLFRAFVLDGEGLKIVGKSTLGEMHSS